jgi:hypothetical protein
MRGSDAPKRLSYVSGAMPEPLRLAQALIEHEKNGTELV